MKAEDQYLIDQVEVWVCREGKGIVEERHLKTPEDFIYHKVLDKQTRYVIIKPSGIIHLPHLIYETPINNECYFASGYLRSSRKYLRPLDATYFKFLDDAELVKNNIISFIRWLRTVKTSRLQKMQKKTILLTYGDLLREALATPEWETISKRIWTGKNRKDLAPFRRDLQDELDFLPEKD